MTHLAGFTVKERLESSPEKDSRQASFLGVHPKMRDSYYHLQTNGDSFKCAGL
jgi:hypothetical protein